MKKVFKIGLIFILALAVLGTGFWYLYTHKNIGINKEYMLTKSVKQYSDLIDVGLYEQAFNEFLTSTAKAKVQIKYEDIPLTNEEFKKEQDRISKCPKGPGRIYADFGCVFNSPKKEQRKIEVSALETFTKYATTRKNDWKDISIDKIIYPSKNRADVFLKLEEKSHSDTAPIETWYFENNNWLRDF